jgi:hypothetical protein
MVKNTIIIMRRVLPSSLLGVILLPIFLGNSPDSMTKSKSKIVGIQAFQIPISKAGISVMITSFSQHSRGQHACGKPSIILGDFIVKNPMYRVLIIRWPARRHIAEGGEQDE